MPEKQEPGNAFSQSDKLQKQNLWQWTNEAESGSKNSIFAGFCLFFKILPKARHEGKGQKCKGIQTRQKGKNPAERFAGAGPALWIRCKKMAEKQKTNANSGIKPQRML